MSNGSRLMATPLPLTPGQQEGLRTRITEPLTPTETPSENTGPASSGKTPEIRFTLITYAMQNTIQSPSQIHITNLT